MGGPGRGWNWRGEGGEGEDVRGEGKGGRMVEYMREREDLVRKEG